MGEQGTCYFRAQIVFEAWGLSSKLIEATMVVAALVAIEEWIGVWLVASNDSGTQGATVHGAKSIPNSWYHTFAT